MSIRFKRYSNETTTPETQVKGQNSWILNTSATNHVTYLKEHFTAIYKIIPINIKLPNGSFIIAHYAGIVQIQYFIYN